VPGQESKQPNPASDIMRLAMLAVDQGFDVNISFVDGHRTIKIIEK
jgi:prepilin-type processing-associated H-X9-DG protein